MVASGDLVESGLVTGRAGIVILRILHMATNVVAWIHTGFKPGMLKYQLPVGVNMLRLKSNHR